MRFDGKTFQIGSLILREKNMLKTEIKKNRKKRLFFFRSLRKTNSERAKIRKVEKPIRPKFTKYSDKFDIFVAAKFVN